MSQIENRYCSQGVSRKSKIRNTIIILICILAVGITILSGCAAMAKKAPVQAHANDMQSPPVFETFERPAPAEGSLWANAGNTRLFVDMRAREVGDLVTVRISEKPTGKLYAETQTSRDSSVEAGVTDFFGKNRDPSSLFNANFKPSFKGQGTNNREGELEAYVTARVIQALPSGNLRILGRQEIKVNNETQHITISGIIRCEDIDTNNEIQSTYVADARIEYSGKGVIADKQRPGWLGRTLDYLWPF
ncbi:MAG: flagellar basal body L-ring protein FlgH [Desulfobacterales bacterium]|nr:flagellar basal body L-ring protein FlgH [Desulfobacterales bacterium]